MAFDIPWVRMIDPQPEESAPGKLVLACEPDEIHLNHNRDVNAGVLFSLAEMAGMGVVVASLGEQAQDSYVVIKRCVIDFIAPAAGRVRAAATMSDSQLDRVRARALGDVGIEEVVPVEIVDAAGRVVAACEVTAVIRPKRKQG